MKRRELLATLVATLGAGVSPRVFGSTVQPEADWTPVREWRLGKDSPLRSLLPAVPLILCNVGLGLTAQKVAAALSRSANAKGIGIIGVSNSGGLPLSDFIEVVGARTSDVPAFAVLERNGAAERVRLILPDRTVVLNSEWALRALPKATEE